MINTQVNHEFNTDEGREWIRGLLHDQHIKDLRITFTKKDGTERTMRPTLIESRIPLDKQPKTSVGVEEATNSQTSGSAIRVFDTEVQEWRSFRWDSIKELRFDL
jgi:hypothetical protein